MTASNNCIEGRQGKNAPSNYCFGICPQHSCVCVARTEEGKGRRRERSEKEEGRVKRKSRIEGRRWERRKKGKKKQE